MPEKLTGQSVRGFPDIDNVDGFGESGLVMRFANAYQDIPAWGTEWKRRDEELRKFWLSESFLTSAVYSIAAARAAFGWTLSGPPRTVKQVQKLLHASEFNKGWPTLQLKVATDVLTQDNGGFVEVIRDDNTTPRGKVIGLSHLDAAKCFRTGNPEYPVIYYNSKNDTYHKLAWFNVITFEDFPHPAEEHRGRQVCFVSRVLHTAYLVHWVSIHNKEKVTGRFHKAIHVVSGVTKRNIDAAMRKADYEADNRGMLTLNSPVVLTTLDPNTQPKAISLQLAELPENFDEDELFKRYITLIAMAAGGEYQDFSPLPGGSLGSSEQSEILHRKAQRKGHALWMKTWEHVLQNGRIIPRNVTFQFHQQDTAADLEQAKLTSLRVKTRRDQIESGEISGSVARQLAVDAGDLQVAHLALMEQTDRTSFIAIDDSDPDVSAVMASDVVITEEEEKQLRNLPGAVRFEAAQWITKLIDLSQLSAIMPLNEHQLKTFEFVLAKRMEAGAITFGEFWYDQALVDACAESGLKPHVLKQYLPENYVLYVTPSAVYDSKTVLYSHNAVPSAPVVVEKEVAHIQRTGLDKEYTPYYRPTKGWYLDDEDTEGALAGVKGNLQYNISELIDHFSKTIEAQEQPTTYVFSCLTYALLLGRKDRAYLSEEEDMSLLQKYMSKAGTLIKSGLPKLCQQLLTQMYFEAKY